MIRIIENQAGNDQIQMLTAETQMALREIRGVARIFPELRTFFSNLPASHQLALFNLQTLQSHRPDSLYRGLLCM